MTLNKKALLRDLSKTYPTIKWELIQSSDDVIRNYGRGSVLRGTMRGKSKDFFVLDADKNAYRWADVIYAYLYNTVKEEEDNERW